MVSKKSLRGAFQLGCLFLAAFTAFATSNLKFNDLLDNGNYSIVSDCSDAAKKSGQVTYTDSLGAATGNLAGATEFGFPSDTLERQVGDDGVVSTGDNRHCKGMVYDGSRADIVFLCYDAAEALQCTITMHQI